MSAQFSSLMERLVSATTARPCTSTLLLVSMRISGVRPPCLMMLIALASLRARLHSARADSAAEERAREGASESAHRHA